ncbi:hypothetical protein GW17_00048480 [Ensete ventricosum]|nr:hypothetical protein GW17_00048480 [Ensete ventricosum]
MSILLIKTLKDTGNMELSKRKLEEALEETCKELDKALQELARLKQHILEKMTNLCLQPPNMSQVLDLMVRMLGFTEEDRQRIGFAQHAAGKGIVRGMLGLPGRLVGGFLGGLNSPETSSSDNLVKFLPRPFF